MSNTKGLLTEEQIHHIVQDEQYYDFFDNECDERVDHITIDSDDTNSEIDGTDNDDSDITSDSDTFFLGKDKVTKWMKSPPSTSKNTKHNGVISGPKSDAKNVTTIYDAFALFFDEYVYSILVENTNIYIETEVLPKCSRSRDAKPITMDEMKAFVGLLIVAGVMRLSHLNYKELFAEDDFAGEFFYKTMNNQRFLFILRCLRFDDERTREERLIDDQLAPIRVLFDNIITKFSNFFSPSEYVTVDEQLVGFRGQCSFRQYIPSKRARYGIKLFAMCDAINFYTVNVDVYLGTQPEGPYKVGYSPQEILDRLLKSIDKSGRNITTNSWYTSIPLASHLLAHNITTVGALRKNKKEIPAAFLPNKHKAVKSTLFGFTNTATLVSYTPKKSKSVLLLSTMHHDGTIESGNSKKPEILNFYDMTQGGVDTTDKMCATYDVGRRCRRWSVTLFFHLINVCAVNAYIIYNHNCPNTKIERRNFLKQLGKEMVKDYQKSRLECPNVPRKIRKLLGELSTPGQSEEPEPTTVVRRKRCYLCPRCRNRQSRVICLHCKKNICSEHTKILCNDCYECNA